MQIKPLFGNEIKLLFVLVVSYSVCHITTVHPQTDVRIFLKECRSLRKNGYKTTLLVVGGESESRDGVEIIGIPATFSSRIDRIRKAPKLAFSKALEINADCYHFHDPEFLPYALKLTKKGKKVIYDVHEDVPRQILSKHWLPSVLRGTISKVFENYENKVSRKLSGIVTATPHIANRFKAINSNTTDINNFPIIEELREVVNDFDQRIEVCYVGGLDEQRGIKQIVQSMCDLDLTLHLAGKFDPENFKSELEKESGWVKVKFHGFLDRKGVQGVYSNSIAGLVTLMPIVNYIDSLPVKMFEYMLAGIPVVASNFPLWKEIVEKNNCGICVDPENVDEISAAIKRLSSNRQLAYEMGQNGRKAVLEKYNWANEEVKLLNFYHRILNA